MLVSIDTLRADHVGCYGAAFAHTPQLDALAAGGVRFATAISPAPLTLPSHTTLLTGLDPPQHGVRHNGVYQLAADVPTLPEQLRASGFATAAFVASYVLDRQFGLARGFESYDDRTSREQSGRGLLGFAERPGNEVVDAALAWLATAPERFFLWVHLYDAHAEYRPPPGFASAFASRPYDGEIAFADAQLGRLLAAVRERFPDERTLVVVTADHGESLGEHGEPTHSHFVYEGTQHIPLVMRGPGLPAGRVVEGVVALRDVAPTILDLADVAALPGAGGESLLPALRGSRSERGTAYVETLATQLDWDMSPLLGLRTDGFKYIRAPRPELYDLAADAGEERNLAELDPGRAAELDAELGRRAATARSPAPNLELDEAGRERLEALGYFLPAEPTARDDLGEVGGPDPKDAIGTLSAIYRADRLIGEGRPSEALAVLLPLQKQSLVYHALVAAAALGAGQGPLAESAARKALRAAPQHRVGWARLARALEAQERWEEARSVYQEMATRHPDAGEPLTALGRLAEWRGDLGAAAAHYRRALAMQRADPNAAWRLAALELEADRPAEADALLADLPGTVLEDPDAARRVARAERRAGRGEAAIARLGAAASANPGSLELRLDHASALAEMNGDAEQARGEREAALATANRALDGAEDAHRAYLLQLRARAFADLGRREEAARDLREALNSPELLPPEPRREARDLAAALRIELPDPVSRGAPGSS